MLAAVIGLCAGIFGSLDNALIQTVSSDPAYLGRVTSVVSLTMVGLAPLSYPLVGAAIGAWGAAPVFVGCGAFASLGVAIAPASNAVRRRTAPAQLNGYRTIRPGGLRGSRPSSHLLAAPNGGRWSRQRRTSRSRRPAAGLQQPRSWPCSGR